MGITAPNRREAMRLGLRLGIALTIPSRSWAELRETPAFKKDVTGEKLPKIEERVPEEPAVAELETIGKPGGELRMLMG